LFYSTVEEDIMAVATRVDLGRVEVVSMRELTLHTAAVVDRVRMDGCPRAIVKHGRFQAALWPLPAGLESKMLADAVDRGRFVLEEGSAVAVPVQDLVAGDAGVPDDGHEPSITPEGSGRAGQDQRYGIATMSELNQKSSEVVGRVRDGEHLVLTRHGRFVALLVPVPQNLESMLLARAAAFMETLDDGTNGSSSGLAVDVAQAWAD
jgi:prevent-host-death family protein